MLYDDDDDNNWQVPAIQWHSWSIKLLTGVCNLEHFIFPHSTNGRFSSSDSLSYSFYTATVPQKERLKSRLLSFHRSTKFFIPTGRNKLRF